MAHGRRRRWHSRGLRCACWAGRRGSYSADRKRQERGLPGSCTSLAASTLNSQRRRSRPASSAGARADAGARCPGDDDPAGNRFVVCLRGLGCHSSGHRLLNGLAFARTRHHAPRPRRTSSHAQSSCLGYAQVMREALALTAPPSVPCRSPGLDSDESGKAVCFMEDPWAAKAPATPAAAAEAAAAVAGPTTTPLREGWLSAACLYGGVPHYHQVAKGRRRWRCAAKGCEKMARAAQPHESSAPRSRSAPLHPDPKLSP